MGYIPNKLKKPDTENNLMQSYKKTLIPAQYY
jgi:hypothetical protein